MITNERNNVNNKVKTSTFHSLYGLFIQRSELSEDQNKRGVYLTKIKIQES